MRVIWALIIETSSLEAFLHFSDLIVICTLIEISSNPAIFFYWFRNQTTSHLLIHQNFSSINESCWKISNCQKRCVCMHVFEKLIWKAWQWKQYRHTVKGVLKMMEREKSQGWKVKKKIVSSLKILRLSLHEMHVMTRWGGVCGC